MLLTVIAVATLLVAVVGATFAYFSLQVDGGAQTTTATAEAGKLPLITLAEGEDTFGMTVTAEDMDKTNSTGGDKSMWANVSPSESGSSSGGTWSTGRQNVAVAKLSTTNANVGVTYTCNFSITVTVGPKSVSEPYDEKTNMYKALLGEGGSKHTGDLILHLGFASGTTGAFETRDKLVSDGSNGGVKIDIADIAKSEPNEKTSGSFIANGTIDVSSTNTIGGQEAKIIADLELVNKRDESQNYLAGTDIRVTLTTTGSNCQEKEK